MQPTSSKRRVTRREAGGWRGAQATAGRKRQEHDDAGEEVEGKGRAGEAKRAAMPAIAAAACASAGRVERAGFDLVRAAFLSLSRFGDTPTSFLILSSLDRWSGGAWAGRVR